MAHHIYSLFISCRKDFFDKKNCPLLSQRAILEAPPRFELGIRVLQTHALPLGYSAIVFTFVKSQACFTKVKTLPPLLRGLWSGLRGSNSLPPPWQGGALPDELNPHILLYAAFPKMLKEKWRPGWDSNPRPPP